MGKSKLKSENSTSFLKNILMLMFSQVVVKVLGLVYKVVIVDVEGFGNTGNGYYATGYQIYMVLLAVSSIGIPNVISKLVSERTVKGDYAAAHRIFKTALCLFTGFGFSLFLLLFFGADFIANNLLHASGVKYTLMVLAPALCFVPASAVMRGYFAGLGSMKASSNSQIVEQFFNCVLSIGFVYACVGKDTAIMAAAGNLSTTCACIIACSYLVLFYRKRRGEIKNECATQTVTPEKNTRKQLILIILSVSIPITLSSLVSTANSAIDTITVSRCVQNAFASVIADASALEEKAMELYGILQKAEIVTHLPLAVSATLCTAIVPAISSALAKNNKAEANSKIASCVFISSLLIFPCMSGFVVLASPILHLLYPSVPEGSLILQLLCIILPFSSLTYVLNGILYGIGKQHVPAIALTIGSVIKLGLNVWLMSIPQINIYGAVISTIIYQAVVFIIETVVVYKTIEVRLDYIKCFVKPALASIIMGAIVLGAYRLIALSGSNTLATLVSIIIGAVVYLAFLFVIKTFTKEDIKTIPFLKKFI